MNENRLRDLDLSSDEITRFSNAFSDTTFKDLLTQYLQEISDPENQKIFENEIIQLEAKQGNDIIFVKPTPGYVLKTTVDGNYKAYINICSSDKISKLNYSPSKQNNVHGVNVSIPHSLSPIQKGKNKKNVCFSIYTVVFHPDTLDQAEKNAEIKNIVEETALDIIEKSCKVKLDTVNYKLSKKSIKGKLQLTTIRKHIETNSDKNGFSALNNISNNKKYTEPIYRIKYRNEVDLQNNTMDRFCKMDILIPKQVMIEIDLPLLKSIQNTTLNVESSSISLKNENPKYKLNISLPYMVEKDGGSAKFDSDNRILKLELPIKKKMLQSNEDMKPTGNIIEICNEKIEEPRETKNFNFENIISETKIDSPFVNSSSRNDDYSLKTVVENTNISFLNADIKYKIPPYFCNYYQNKIAFTISIKNVNYSSFDYRILEDKNGFWIKFTSLGTGYYPMYYAMCVIFYQTAVNFVKSLEYSMESSSVFVYVYLDNDVTPLEYYVGTDKENLKKEYLNEPDAVYLEVNNRKTANLNVNFDVSKFSTEKVIINGTTCKTFSINTNDLLTSQPEFNNLHAQKEFTAVEPASKIYQIDKHSINGIDEVVYSDDVKSQKNNLHTSETLLSANKERNFVQTTEINTLCDNFKTQFSIENESNCMSETELHVSNISKKNRKQFHSDNENHPWIVETKNAKKAKRKKKAHDKKFGIKNEESENGKTESVKDYDNRTPKTTPIDIRSAYKFSDMTSRSILKNKNRSFSESSGDELYHTECSRSFSIDDINFSSDSYSQSIPKKTVRFNDVISKKLYSSDISIFEQRKRTKRRSQRKERKASDSENSETETASLLQVKRNNIRIYNENLLSENSEIELTSLSESGGETSDDQSDNPDAVIKMQPIPCSKKNHKRRGKKSARKNASTAKHHFQADF